MDQTDDIKRLTKTIEKLTNKLDVSEKKNAQITRRNENLESRIISVNYENKSLRRQLCSIENDYEEDLQEDISYLQGEYTSKVIETIEALKSSCIDIIHLSLVCKDKEVSSELLRIASDFSSIEMNASDPDVSLWNRREKEKKPAKKKPMVQTKLMIKENKVVKLGNPE